MTSTVFELAKQKTKIPAI